MGEISARIRFYYDKGTDSVEAHKKLLVLWLKCIVGKNGPVVYIRKEILVLVDQLQKGR